MVQRRTLMIVILVVSALLPRAAGAQRMDFTKCGTLPQQSMNVCFATEAHATAVTMDSVLAELARTQDADEMAGIRRVQGAWTAYAAAECDWRAAQYGGGSLAPTVRATCLTRHRWDRIEELAAVLCDGASGQCRAARRYQRPKRWHASIRA